MKLRELIDDLCYQHDNLKSCCATNDVKSMNGYLEDMKETLDDFLNWIKTINNELGNIDIGLNFNTLRYEINLLKFYAIVFSKMRELNKNCSDYVLMDFTKHIKSISDWREDAVRTIDEVLCNVNYANNNI